MSRYRSLRTIVAGAALAAGLVGLTLWWTAPALLARGAADRLDSFLPIVARLLEADLGAPPETLQPRVRSLTRASDLRLTLIRADGVVAADSERTADGVARMDNHGGRPEVRRALELGRGESVRRSRTTGLEYVYLARRLSAPGGGVWVLRLAQPLHRVPLAAAEQLSLFLLPLAVAALAGAASGWWIDRRLLGPLRLLAGSLDTIAGGAEDGAIGGSQPVAGLATRLARLGGRFRQRIEALEGERSDFVRIVDTMSDGVLVADRDRRVVLVNPAFRELFGAGFEGEAPSVLELSRSPDLAAFIEHLGAAESALQERIDSEVGRAFELSGLHLGGGRILVVARDLSDEVRLDATRRDLVANVSHELRTPLAAIRGYAENLEQGALDEPPVARRFIGRILAQCARLEALVEDLLALSRLERGDEAAAGERRPVDLGSLAEQTLETVRALADEREVRLELRSANAAVVDGSPGALERMLLNLLHNAVKYNRPGGSVTVELARRGESIVVEVADTGLGIAARDLPRIFERFYRVDSGRSREEGSTGLGLAIVKHAAQIHGGRVEVASELGRGSVFTVVLPAGRD